MSEENAQVVVAQAHDKERAVLVPRDVRPDEAHAQAKAALFHEVKEIVSLIRLDRNDILERIVEGQRAQVSEAAREVLADPFGLVGTHLFRTWKEEQVELPHTHLYEGMCGHEIHSWFRLESPAEECGEPNYYYIIDPFSRGLSVLHLGPITAESDFVVVKPWSPFNKMYFGRKVGTLNVERGHA